MERFREICRIQTQKADFVNAVVVYNVLVGTINDLLSMPL